jgi:single-strand DNA-binding protein
VSAPITLTGRLGKAPELRFSQNGKAVASFSVVTDKRQKNQQTQEWESVATTWWRCTAFGELAENLTESLDQGAAVVVMGRVEEESWEDKQTGAKRTAMKVIVDDVGPSLRYATAKVAKAQRGGSNGGGQQQGGQTRGQQNQGSNYGGWDNSRPADAMPAGGRQAPGSGWGASSDEAPF